jgi:hypothetical protein
MNRDKYIEYRKNNDINIIYEFYKEKFDSSKHKPFLSGNDVVHLLQNTGYNLRTIMGDCLVYFDNKFTLVKIYKGNDLISFT